MKSPSKNFIEDGIPAGTWNKYESRNPIQRYLVNSFLESLRRMAAPYVHLGESSMDVGCGEGMTTNLFCSLGFRGIRGFDFSESVLAEARSNYPEIEFLRKDIYEIGPDDACDFVAACEVFEHLEDPDLGLDRIALGCRKIGLFSVPNEPLFRLLNFCAGKYWRDFGNSPGHLNHWSSRSFVRFLSRRFRVISVVRSLPWTIVACEPIP